MKSRHPSSANRPKTGLMFVAFAACACSGTSTTPDGTAPSSGGNGSPASGGATSTGSASGGSTTATSSGGATTNNPNTGGASTGGASTGGASTGGASAGGASAGGASAGGDGQGGAVIGGKNAGGADTGGTMTGGNSTGGTSKGGTGTGATSTGGTSKGGTGTGGTSTGGAGKGGTSTGGIGNGGTSTGGASSAGASNALCNVGVWDGTTKPTPLSLSGNIGVHDPTMILANGVYYRFWTGNNIPSAKSTNLTTWTNATSVYTNGYSAWTTEWLAGISGETFNFPWAPDVSFFNGKYHIYSSFSAKFGDNISCITHLTTSDLAAGNWVDQGTVICTTGSENYNAIDADVGVDAAGTPWLAFGSFWNGIMGFQLNPDGSRLGTTLTRLAWASQIEAPVLFYRCGYYYLFVTWGLCCPGEGRTIDQLTYRVAVGRSQSIMGPYTDRSGKAMLDGGGTLMVEGDDVTWAAAGHSDVLVSGNKIYHLYHGYLQSSGASQLRIVEMPFDSEGWPVPAGP